MLNKITAKKKLENLIEKYQNNRAEIRNKANKYTEADARREYIDPFLEIFGWDIQNKKGKSLSDSDVITENKINKQDKPDYSLRRNGTIYYTVEAEKPGKNIHKDLQPSTQVLRYGWSAGNKVGILTNFETFQIFQTYQKPDLERPNKPWKSIEYTKYTENFDLLWKFLSIDNVYNGTTDKEIDKITPKSATKTNLDSFFLSELDSWRVLIGEDLIHSCSRDDYINPDNHFKKLNDDVQTFLNQIIFLRFAEDNQLERHDENELDYIFNDPSAFNKKLKKLDARYNSGIFENSNIGSLLSMDTIETISNSLYYPKSSYNFAVIDLGILGRIYEQFLQHELRYDQKSDSVALFKTQQASIKAVVSTPLELTRIIAHQALAKKLSNINSIEDLLQLKIADISSGSGVFLISAYDEVISKAIDLLNIRQESNNVEAPLKLKKQIISKMLYGADIDYHASQITKFSLALRLLRGESPTRFRGQTPIIPALGSNIQNHNSLISDDDIANLLTSDSSKVTELTDTAINYINPNDGNLDQFDVILGNPPYMSTSDMKESSTIEFSIYKSKFKSAYKQFDKYFLFLEQMLNQLKPNGLGTFIVPNKFVAIGAGKHLRSILYEHVDSMIDFGAAQLFKGKDTYVAIITISKQKVDHINYAEVNSLSEAATASFTKLDMKQVLDTNSNWLLTSNKETIELYNKMKDFPKITDSFSVHNGIQTSKNPVYLIKKNEIQNVSKGTISFTKKGKTWNIELASTRPFFKNISHKGTYYSQPDPDSYVIFPYHDDGEFVLPDELQKNYPNCWKYLNYYKNDLLPKQYGGKRDVQPAPAEDEWYRYGRQQGLSGWNRSKLIVGVMSNKPSTAFDQKHMLIASGGTAGYVAIFNKNDEYALEYIEAWMNYPAIDDLFKVLSTSFRGGFWTHGTNVMKLVPFLTIDKDNQSETDLYQQIVKIMKQINMLSNGRNQTILIKTINKLLDKLVKIKLG